MTARDGIFPTFFLSGFECSSFDWKEEGRRDIAQELRHYQHADEDYAMLPPLGIAVAREGIPWPLVDPGSVSGAGRGCDRYDFSRIDGFLGAQRRHNILPIWDLCHYGYPGDLDPFGDPDAFVARFTAYARAAARYVAARAHHGPLCITPINEPTFWGYMGGEWAWCAPFGKTPEQRRQFTLTLARADISACKAIREDFPDTRFVHIDPLIWVVPPRDRPDLADEAHREAYEDAYIAWDVISGLKLPEYGGSPELIDIIGLNNYSFGQMEYQGGGKPNQPLEPGDDRIRPLADLIEESWAKYQRPCIVAETSGLGGGRPDWLNDVTCECLAAVNRGVELHGICLFPAVDMQDWHSREWLHMGIADVAALPDGSLMRTPFVPYVEALHRWEKRLRRVTRLDEDPYDEPVSLDDIRAAAREIDPKSDAAWG
ncbi:MAG: b-glycosidase [Pseudomonadota bacterium]|nr:b-glycosidase [Pseudomonadota bacterium]